MSFNCFWSWRFSFTLSLLSSVQYSKQSSATIAYINTVRNGRQRIKNRHETRGWKMLSSKASIEHFKRSSLASIVDWIQVELKVLIQCLNSKTLFQRTSSRYIWAWSMDNENAIEQLLFLQARDRRRKIERKITQLNS